MNWWNYYKGQWAKRRVLIKLKSYIEWGSEIQTSPVLEWLNVFN